MIGLKKMNKSIWKIISWSTIFEMKLICTTFLFSNSYCIICERTVTGTNLKKPLEGCGNLVKRGPKHTQEKCTQPNVSIACQTQSTKEQ